jgi:hypothetical protein
MAVGSRRHGMRPRAEPLMAKQAVATLEDALARLEALGSVRRTAGGSGYWPLGPVSPNPAPAGSVATTIHSPVGTSWGPMSTVPPLV